MKAPKFKEFISEKVERSDIQVAILTKINADSKSVVSNMIAKECKSRNIPCHIINTSSKVPFSKSFFDTQASDVFII